MFACKERSLKFKNMEDLHMYFRNSTEQMLSVMCLNREEYERSLQKQIYQCLKNNFGK